LARGIFVIIRFVACVGLFTLVVTPAKAWCSGQIAGADACKVGAIPERIEPHPLIHVERDVIALAYVDRPKNYPPGAYPTLCRAQGLVFPPPFKDFAKQLALLMPRTRKDIRQGGKRTHTATLYAVRDPAKSVVELAAVKRKRA
jgi:hypothetical protein